MIRLSVVLCVLGLASQAIAASPSKSQPVIWYCLAYNTPNVGQYKPAERSDRGWWRAAESLKAHVDLRVSDHVPTPDRLEGVDLVLIFNPEKAAWEGGPEPRHIEDAAATVLTDYIRAGGALLFMSNQDALHNVEKTESNRLLERFGLRVGRADIGIKILKLPKSSPVIGGLTWRFFFGSPLEVLKTPSARVEVWAWNDPGAETVEGEPGDRVPLLAGSRFGKGRVVVASDTGWTANGTIGLDDNWAILWKTINWLTPRHDLGPVADLAAPPLP
jgi:hypothetical protein